MHKRFREGWYVLHVRSRCEKKVEAALRMASVDAYLPLAKRVKRWSDRRKETYEPLFRSYVFVYIHQPSEFSKAKWTEGVCDFIQFGNRYARVKDEEIQNIKILMSSGLDNIYAEGYLPKTGETYSIKEGPLQGLECEIVKARNEQKIIVRVRSIHLNITASLPAGSLQRTRGRHGM
ncbi:MAG: UpxY family transcription antiterminator [Bacteroidota bacterium]